MPRAVLEKEHRFIPRGNTNESARYVSRWLSSAAIAVLLHDPHVTGSHVLHVYRGVAGGLEPAPVQVIAVGHASGGSWESRALF